MNPRAPELQAIRLTRFFLMPQWPKGAGLRKIDGQWMLLPTEQSS